LIYVSCESIIDCICFRMKHITLELIVVTANMYGMYTYRNREGERESERERERERERESERASGMGQG
jgi:hypothetical protein